MNVVNYRIFKNIFKFNTSVCCSSKKLVKLCQKYQKLKIALKNNVSF